MSENESIIRTCKVIAIHFGDGMIVVGEKVYDKSIDGKIFLRNILNKDMRPFSIITPRDGVLFNPSMFLFSYEVSDRDYQNYMRNVKYISHPF